MKTQQELEAMTNKELNMIICMNYIPVIVEDNQAAHIPSGDSAVMVNDIVDMYPMDFCNNWSDCGKLIDELDDTGYLTIECDRASYDNHDTRTEVKQRNGKRAVTIVYILIKQGEL